jgi:hypothetical protein
MSVSGARNQADPFSQFLAPETDVKSLLLGPEIPKMGQQYFWGQKLTLCFRFWPHKLMGERNFMPKLLAQ